MNSDCLAADSQANMLDAWLAADVTSPQCFLFVNDVTPTPQTVYSDLTPASFSGSPQSVEYGTVFDNQDGSLQVAAVSMQFDFSGGPGDSEVVFGYGVTQTISATPVLISSRRLDSPQEMSKALDAVIVAPSIKQPAIQQG